MRKYAKLALPLVFIHCPKPNKEKKTFYIKGHLDLHWFSLICRPDTFSIISEKRLVLRNTNFASGCCKYWGKD